MTFALLVDLAASGRRLADIAEPLRLRSLHISTDVSSLMRLQNLRETQRGRDLLWKTDKLVLEYADEPVEFPRHPVVVENFYSSLQPYLAYICPFYLDIRGYNRYDERLSIVIQLAANSLLEIRLGPQIRTDFSVGCQLFGQCNAVLRRFEVLGSLLDWGSFGYYWNPLEELESVSALDQMQTISPEALSIARFGTATFRGVNPFVAYLMRSSALTTLVFGNSNFSHIGECLKLCGQSLKTLVCDTWFNKFASRVPKLQVLITRSFEYAPGTEQTWFPTFPPLLESLTLYAWRRLIKKLARWVRMDGFRPGFSYLLAIDDHNPVMANHQPLDEIVNAFCRDLGIIVVWSATIANHDHDSLPIVADAGPAMGTEYLIPEGFITPGPRIYRSTNEVLAA